MKVNISIYKILVILCISLILPGCQKKMIVEEEKKPSSEPSEIDNIGFNPLEMPQDRQIIPVKYPRSGNISGFDELVETTDNQQDTIAKLIENIPDNTDTLNNQAYRIQIFTTKVYGDARASLKIAEEIFDRPLFLDYEVPYYKLRVGNFNDKEKAEEYQLRAKAAGYSDAERFKKMGNISMAYPASTFYALFKVDGEDDSDGQ